MLIVRRTRLAAAVLALAGLTLGSASTAAARGRANQDCGPAVCGGARAPDQPSQPPAAPPAPPPPAHAIVSLKARVPTDWATSGFDLARSGENPDEAMLNPATVRSLRQSWTFDAGARIDTQPTVATAVNVTVRGRSAPADLVFVGSEHGDFFAVNAAHGTRVWARHLGSRTNACTDIPDGRYGVTAAPVLDKASNTVYVAGGDGRIWALSMSTGATKPGWPVRITSDPDHEHIWGALTVASGAVYAAVGSYCDVIPYHGRVVKIGIATHRVRGRWLVVPPSAQGGGIWGWGGVSVDPASQRIYVATGNVPGVPSEHSYYANHLVELDMNLNFKAANFPGGDGIDDDFGSTPVLYRAPGCGPQLAVMRKDGALYVYNRNSIRRGPLQTLRIDGSHSFIGMPAYDTDTGDIYVAHAEDSRDGTYKHGLVALKVGADCRLSLAWQRVGSHIGVTSSPTVAGGVVYYGNGHGRKLLAYDAADGRPLWNSGTELKGSAYAAVTVVNGTLFAGSWDHKLHAFSTV